MGARRRDLAFFLTFTTLLLGFAIEHQGYRERAAMQVKLDADRSTIAIEDRPAKEIDSVRDAGRAREGHRTVG